MDLKEIKHNGIVKALNEGMIEVKDQIKAELSDLCQKEDFRAIRSYVDDLEQLFDEREAMRKHNNQPLG
jgi:hypothetical protein